jgi:hypothetical protein
MDTKNGTALTLGGPGKTGRRAACALAVRGLAARTASRTTGVWAR